MFKSKRLYANIVLFGSFLFIPMMPWYALLLIALLMSWLITYPEIIAIGFLMDISYNSASFPIFGYHFSIPITLLVILLYYGIAVIKSKMRV